jgi:hypothetical protein
MASFFEAKNEIVTRKSRMAQQAQLKAKLRAAVFSTLSQQDTPDAANPKLAALMASSEGPLLVSLLSEFLDFYNLKYTASVLIPEANAASDATPDRDKLAKDLGLPSSSGSSLLQELLGAYRESNHGSSDRQPLPTLRDDDFDLSSEVRSSGAPAEIFDGSVDASVDGSQALDAYDFVQPAEMGSNKQEDRPKSRMSAAESVEEDYDDDFEESFDDDNDDDEQGDSGEHRSAVGLGVSTQAVGNRLGEISGQSAPRARRGLLGALPTVSKPAASFPALTPALDMDQSVEDSQALDLYDSVNSISMAGSGTDDDFVQSAEHIDVDQSFNFDGSVDPSVDGSQALDAYDFVQPIQPLER